MISTYNKNCGALLAIVLFILSIYPFLSKADSSPNAFDSEVGGLFSEAAHGKYSDGACIALMQKYWPSSFNQTWPKTDTGNFASGKRIPKAFLEIIAQPESGGNFSIDAVLRSLSGGSQPFISNDAEKTGFRAISAACILAIESTKANSVPLLFASMENRLPTSRGDFAILSAVNAYLHNREAFTLAKMPPKDLEEWNKMARSKNPVFRLLAAMIFDSLVDNPTDRGAFFSTYSDETDARIANLAIEMDASSGFKSQVPALLKIAEGQQAIGNSDVAKIAKEKAADISAHGVIGTEGD
jgi:hypothetical protein